MDYSKLYIDGQWRESSGQQFFTVENPATQQSCAKVVMGTQADVDYAVSAAKKAFKSWSQTSSEQRGQYLSKLVERLKFYRQDLALVISQSMGIPLHMAAEVQVDEPINILQSYVQRTAFMDEIKQIGNAHVYKHAIGVCALISPWNYPLNQLMGKLAPALAAGCTVVVKPSEQTSLQDFIVAQACDDIGLPKGVFNLVPGYGQEVGAALSSHPDVRMISFTGSTRAGIHIAQNAAPSVKRVVQELGGKSPLIIDKACDLNAAVEYGIEDVMINTGQTCTAYSRWLVHKDVLSQVESLAKQQAENIKVGSDQSAFMGPMVSETQLARVKHYIQIGMDEGATLLTGGLEKPKGLDVGHYIQPTIFTNVKNTMTIAQEEIFGPVVCLIPFENSDNAIELANESEYGLAAAVFSRNTETGLHMAKQLDAGMVYINGASYNIEAPFGGMKHSGNGREFGDEGLDEYVELKVIHI